MIGVLTRKPLSKSTMNCLGRELYVAPIAAPITFVRGRRCATSRKEFIPARGEDTGWGSGPCIRIINPADYGDHRLPSSEWLSAGRGRYNHSSGFRRSHMAVSSV